MWSNLLLQPDMTILVHLLVPSLLCYASGHIGGTVQSMINEHGGAGLVKQ